MAARIRLSSLAICLLACAMPMAAAAQQDTDDRRPPAAAQSPEPPEVRPEDCKKLPGGNAPINRLARIEGGISVRNLDLTYLGKPLYDFAAQDYAYLKALWPVCETFDAPTAAKVADKLRSLIEDAKAVRRDSLDWIRQTEKDIQALEPSQDGIEKIHDYWQQMLNREFEMLGSDMAHIAGVLSKRRDELYSAPQNRQRTLVSPFDPGPPERRTLGGSGG